MGISNDKLKRVGSELSVWRSYKMQRPLGTYFPSTFAQIQRSRESRLFSSSLPHLTLQILMYLCTTFSSSADFPAPHPPLLYLLRRFPCVTQPRPSPISTSSKSHLVHLVVEVGNGGAECGIPRGWFLGRIKGGMSAIPVRHKFQYPVSILACIGHHPNL